MSTNNQTNQNEVATNEAWQPKIMKVTEVYTAAISEEFKNVQLTLEPYQKTCLINAISKISELLIDNGMEFNNLNQNNLGTVLTQIAMFKLNAAANPRECYFQLRGKKNADGTWGKILEYGIEGNGNDAILRNFGVDVKEVSNAFIIREGDEFNYPYFDGEKMQPFTWKPKSFSAKAIAVAYIVTKTDGTKEYLISERESVGANLKAHISQSLMKSDAKVKAEIMDKIDGMTLEEILADKSLSGYISPAWKSPQSREEMIIRKMKNNCTKKYPKDFRNAFVAQTFEAKEREFINAEMAYETPSEVLGETKAKVGTEPMPEINEETGEVLEPIVENRGLTQEEESEVIDALFPEI